MATVLFFEKPGCSGNARQKAALRAAGHVVMARDLLTHPWGGAELYAYLVGHPVGEWFNRSAPRIKSGEIVPERLDEDGALQLLLADPILIRRPLLLCEGRREVGFDPIVIDAWIGLQADDGSILDVPDGGAACAHGEGAARAGACAPPGVSRTAPSDASASRARSH